jgi:hypothetical protein
VRGLKLEGEPVSLKEETELVRLLVARIQIVSLKHYRRLFVGTFLALELLTFQIGMPIEYL